MIEKLIEDKKRLAIRYKQAMEMAQQRSDKADKYDLTELLNAECSVSHNKAYFIALTREIKDLEELKEQIYENICGYYKTVYDKEKDFTEIATGVYQCKVDE